ncbi:beta-ketoacyl-[acyl-carrier-protein] synthase family protein [Streptomyces sp. NPDC051561]|uniref:beta-ketoacyl-[acyl-carrier-protein] synthase family protein n=1 Tax=Streptomyces sp. NPDC051561 TaxID=3365658 RepID=UPI0037B4E77C
MRRAVVTGIGMVTPAGVGTERSWAGIRAGRSVAQADPLLGESPVGISCRVPEFDPVALLGAGPAHRLDRVSQFALTAVREAVAASGLDHRNWDGTRVGLVLGMGGWGANTLEAQHQRLLAQGPAKVSPYFLPMALPTGPIAPIAIEFGVHGPTHIVCTACASGTSAIGQARQLIATGACDVVLAGGCEASVTPLISTGFSRMGALSRRADDPAGASRPFDADRDGFVMGEGAAVLVLESADLVRSRGARPLATVAGYAATNDAYHAAAPDPAATRAAAAIRGALADAGVSAAEVDHINAHGTGTRLNDVTEARAIRAAVRSTPSVTSVKGVTGHPLGAAGAIEAACTVLSIRDGLVPPTANLDKLDPEIDLDVVAGQPRAQRIGVALSQSLGFAGHNAVLALTSF